MWGTGWNDSRSRNRSYCGKHTYNCGTLKTNNKEGRKCFYLTTHSTHFIYSYMASDIWLRIILIVRKETRCRHIGYSLRLTARVLLYAPSHRKDSTYHGLCYTSRGALAGTRNSSMGSPHEGLIRRPIAPWANTHQQQINCFNNKQDYVNDLHWALISVVLYSRFQYTRKYCKHTD